MKILPVFRKYKHGHVLNGVRSKTYTAWVEMRQRCLNPRHRAYRNYGGRGITICARWLDNKDGFVNFLCDMGEPPTLRHSLDRIDNSLFIDSYSKNNCRWATWDMQAENRRKINRRLMPFSYKCLECNSVFEKRYTHAIRVKFCSKECRVNNKKTKNKLMI